MSLFSSSTGVVKKIKPVVVRALEDRVRPADTARDGVVLERHPLATVGQRHREPTDHLVERPVDLPVQQARRDGGAVHVLEVHRVGRVLERDLRVHRLALVLDRHLRVGAVVVGRVGGQIGQAGEQVGHLPPRRAAGRVVPHEDAVVLLDDRPLPEAVRHVRAVFVRDEAVDAVGPVAPTVIRADDAVVLDLAAVPEVGPEVRAVGVEHVELAGRRCGTRPDGRRSTGAA